MARIHFSCWVRFRSFIWVGRWSKFFFSTRGKKKLHKRFCLVRSSRHVTFRSDSSNRDFESIFSSSTLHMWASVRSIVRLSKSWIMLIHRERTRRTLLDTCPICLLRFYDNYSCEVEWNDCSPSLTLLFRAVNYAVASALFLSLLRMYASSVCACGDRWS